MEKPEIQQDMRVQVTGWGKGTVTDLMPGSNFYVKVKYDLDASPKCRGQEINAEVAKMRPLPPPKPTREEKYQAAFETIRATPESYYIAGLAAVGPSNLHVSSPPKHIERTKEELLSHGVEFETGLSESTDRSMGRSISVIMPDHGLGDEYERKTGVRSTVYQGHAGTVSIQAKQFVLDFLLDFLKFRLGNKQDVDAISERVPSEFKAEFQRGVDEGLSESLLN